jgi:hypothetical protein
MTSQTNPAPAPDTTGLTGETAAAAYIAAELPKVRRTLKRTRIVGVILILGIGVYIGVISAYFVKFFQPVEAAQIASVMLTRHVTDRGPALAVQIEQEIPALIRQLPDYFIKEIPGFRKNLQQSLETEYRGYCSTFARKLGEHTDTLIDEHKAEIKTLLESAGDRAAIRKILPDFDRAVTEFTRNDAEGRALKKHIDDLAAALREIEKRMDRLANGKNLTPEEQKARRALALLARAIEENTAMPETASAHLAKARP